MTDQGPEVFMTPDDLIRSITPNLKQRDGNLTTGLTLMFDINFVCYLKLIVLLTSLFFFFRCGYCLNPVSRNVGSCLLNNAVNVLIFVSDVKILFNTQELQLTTTNHCIY